MPGYLQYKLRAIRSMTFAGLSIVLHVELEDVTGKTELTAFAGVTVPGFDYVFSASTSAALVWNGMTVTENEEIPDSYSESNVHVDDGRAAALTEKAVIGNSAIVTLWLKEWPLTISEITKTASTSLAATGGGVSFRTSVDTEVGRCYWTVVCESGLNLCIDGFTENAGCALEFEAGAGVSGTPKNTILEVVDRVHIGLTRYALLKDYGSVSLETLNQKTLQDVYYRR